MIQKTARRAGRPGRVRDRHVGLPCRPARPAGEMISGLERNAEKSAPEPPQETGGIRGAALAADPDFGKSPGEVFGIVKIRGSRLPVRGCGGRVRGVRGDNPSECSERAPGLGPPPHPARPVFGPARGRQGRRAGRRAVIKGVALRFGQDRARPAEPAPETEPAACSAAPGPAGGFEEDSAACGLGNEARGVLGSARPTGNAENIRAGPERRACP